MKVCVFQTLLHASIIKINKLFLIFYISAAPESFGLLDVLLLNNYVNLSVNNSYPEFCHQILKVH